MKGKLDRKSFIYGNSDYAEESLKKRDAWAVFGKLDSPVHQRGRWALDALKTLEVFSGTPETVNTYEKSIEVFSAASLYAVTRAESNGEVKPGKYNFHRSILKALETEQDIKDEWIAGIEYVGRKEQVEERNRMKSIEQDIYDIEQDIEKKKDETDRKTQQLSNKQKDLEKVEKEIELYEMVSSNSELLTDLFQNIEHMQDSLEQLDHVDEAIIRDLSDIDSKVEDIEADLNQSYTELGEEIEGWEGNLDGIYESLDRFVNRLEVFEEDLPRKVEKLENRVDQRPINIDNLSNHMERELENLDNRLERIEQEVEPESRTSKLLESINQLFSTSDKPGKQTKIDDWTR